METDYVVEWKIENLSHWCAEVHGDCIRSPKFYLPCSYMYLYPKGINGKGEHLVVRLCDIQRSFSSGLSFYCSDGSLLCKQHVNAVGNEDVLEIPGPKFEDVLFRIREDFITVIFGEKDTSRLEKRMCTTINVSKITVKMNPGWIEEMGSNIRTVCFIIFSPDNYDDRITIDACSKNNTVHFVIKTPTKIEDPFAVEMSVRLEDGTVDSCAMKEHVFRDNSPWTFPEPLQKKDIIGKGISLFFCLKTSFFIRSVFYTNFQHRNVSIETNNTPWFSVKGPSTDPVTSNKMTVPTKGSVRQTSLTSALPDDSVLVLSNELMCLYQDQKYSDFQLKCDNVTFPVHKNILSARSPVLDRLLSSDMKEAASGTVDIGDLDPSTLGLFLTYLYTGAVEDLQDDSALRLYYAADKYQVPSLKRDCSKFLCSNVSVSNVCDILSLADRHQDDELTVASHFVILDNFNTVLKSNEWESFMCREPLLAVKTVTHFAKKDSVRKHEVN